MLTVVYSPSLELGVDRVEIWFVLVSLGGLITRMWKGKEMDLCLTIASQELCDCRLLEE